MSRASDEDNTCKNNEYFSVKTRTDIVKIHNHKIYLSNHIDAPHRYVDLINMMRDCTERDTIHLYINSGGGYVKTTIQIMNAMKDCQAKIVTHADGFLASCATWLFLAGDEYIITKDIEFMCHYYSGGMVGKGNEIEVKADFSKKFFKKLFRKIYKKFLTDIEISELIAGKDFWFGHKEVKRRLENKSNG